MTPDPDTAAALRRAVAGDGATRTVTLDPRSQDLPDTAHGGTGSRCSTRWRSRARCWSTARSWPGASR
ncbi:MAG: hypothetical protein FJ027_03145 [Candidatus Rokubacteria bacterium]|nr:hypothetical protein [Candidatus Rokubacteria bacterium]